MGDKTEDLRLWNIEFDQVIVALRDFIEDWKVSKNSDLDEYLKSYSGYFMNDEATKEAIRIVLSYAKELMDGTRSEVDFSDNKIWQTEDGENVRMSRFHTRKAAQLMTDILMNRM